MTSTRRVRPGLWWLLILGACTLVGWFVSVSFVLHAVGVLGAQDTTDTGPMFDLLTAGMLLVTLVPTALLAFTPLSLEVSPDAVVLARVWGTRRMSANDVEVDQLWNSYGVWFGTRQLYVLRDRAGQRLASVYTGWLARKGWVEAATVLEAFRANSAASETLSLGAAPTDAEPRVFTESIAARVVHLLVTLVSAVGCVACFTVDFGGPTCLGRSEPIVPVALGLFAVGSACRFLVSPRTVTLRPDVVEVQSCVGRSRFVVGECRITGVNRGPSPARKIRIESSRWGARVIQRMFFTWTEWAPMDHFLIDFKARNDVERIRRGLSPYRS